MEYSLKTMSKHYGIFVISLLVFVTVSCQANPIDGTSNHKEVVHHQVKSIETTTTPQAATHSQESTKKPDGDHKSPASTLHPPVKGTTGNHQHEAQNASLPEPLPKLCDYLKPICNSTDKIVPKQLSKLQSQFKKIVQTSAGKLGSCFVEHYGFDPNLEPITKANLITLCSSKNMAPKLKASYKSFETCAVQNWDPNVDLELEKIIAARVNCTKNHNHTTTTEVAPLEHEDDEDEFSLISDVVNQVFEDNKGQFANSSDVKFIDVSNLSTPIATTTTTTTTPKPANGSISSSSKPSKVKEIKEETLIADTNTVVTAQDDLNSKTTTPAPAKALVTTKTPAISTVKSPVATINNNNKTTTTTTTTTKIEKPQLEEKAIPVVEKKISSESNSIETEVKQAAPTNGTTSGSLTLKTTAKPDATGSLKATNSTTTVITKTPQVVNTTTTTTVAPKIKTSTTSPPTSKPTTTTAKPSLETLEEVLKRQEKEKKDFDDRMRLERDKIIRQLQKKQDEIDARNAIKALQIQRDASINQNSDAKLHQLEHERQMSIDPIGHTIKHQQYEMSKQQKGR